MQKGIVIIGQNVYSGAGICKSVTGSWVGKERVGREKEIFHIRTSVKIVRKCPARDRLV